MIGVLLGVALAAGAGSAGDPPACVSRRVFDVHLSAPVGERITSVVVVVSGRGEGFRAPDDVRVDLRGLPRGRYPVRFVVRTDAGRTVRSTRWYRTCVVSGGDGGP